MFTPRVQRLVQVIFVILVIAGAFWLSRNLGDNSALKDWLADYGYPAVFLVSIISGVNIVAPIPAISFLPVLVDAGLNTWLTIVLITFGMTIGDVIGYYIGSVSRGFIDPMKHSFVERVIAIRDKYPRAPYVILFFWACFAPLPNEVLVIPMAFAGFRLPLIVAMTLAGNFVFNALAGFGLIEVFSKL